MKRLIPLFVVGVFLVSTPAFGGIKVKQVEDTSKPSGLKATDWTRYRIQNKRHLLNVVSSAYGHEKKMRKQGATLCLELGYSWMKVIIQTGEIIDVACFNSLEKAQQYAKAQKRFFVPQHEPIDCEVLSPSRMRSALWLKKFKAEQDGD